MSAIEKGSQLSPDDVYARGAAMTGRQRRTHGLGLFAGLSALLLLAMPANAGTGPTGSLSGRVVDERTGEGIHGVCIRGAGEAITDENGYYALDYGFGNPVDTLQIRVQDCDEYEQRDFWYEGVFYGNADTEDEIVLLPAGGDHRNVNFSLLPAGKVEGNLTVFGSPHPAVQIAFSYYISPDERHFTQLAYGDPVTGDFSVALPDGPYVARISSSDPNAEAEFYYDQPDVPGELEVHLLHVHKGTVMRGVNVDLGGPDPSPAAQSPTPIPIGDFDDHFFELDVLWLIREGISLGCNPNLLSEFCPDDPVTRGQMAAFLVRALDLTTNDGFDFADDNGHTFETEIEKLASAGITLGCGAPAHNTFCPDDPVTRGQMAAFLVRALDLTTNDGLDFTDDNGHTFETEIEKLASAGITLGCGAPADNTFCPDDPVTRGQMAAFLRRALDES